MCFDVRAVDRHRARDVTLTRRRNEDVVPYPLAAPPIEAIVDRRVRAIGSRTVTPTRPRPQHVQNAADHPAIINPMSPTPTTRQQPLYPRPLHIAQPIKCHHSSLHALKLESHPHVKENPLIEYGP